MFLEALMNFYWFGVGFLISLKGIFNCYPPVIWDNSVFLPTRYWQIHKKQLALFHMEFHTDAHFPPEFTPQFLWPVIQSNEKILQFSWSKSMQNTKHRHTYSSIHFSSFTLEKLSRIVCNFRWAAGRVPQPWHEFCIIHNVVTRLQPELLGNGLFHPQLR